MAITPEQWANAQPIFHAVADLPAGEQPAAVDRLCGSDPELRRVVMDLLAGDAEPPSLLQRDAADVVRQLTGAVPAAIQSGSRIGPYRIVGILGQGGMGVVFKAVRDDVDQVVALKVLRNVWLSPDGRERFTREQRSLARLSHRGIAQLYDSDSLDDGTPWFAMQYVEGETLVRYCTTHGCDVRERLGLFRDVCDAVQHAHQHLIVHRDLKPSNILVSATGVVTLLDFGIAKQLDERDGALDRTRTVARVMTPNYAAPEQLAGGEIGIHTDVYALGVVLYELLTGTTPYALAALSSAHAQELFARTDPRRPSAVAGVALARPTRSEWRDLDVLCLTALDSEPARRYRTVEALIQDVDRFTRREPLQARPSSVGYRATKFARRHARPLAAAALAITVGATGAVAYTVDVGRAREAALLEAAKTKRIQEFMLSLFDGGDPQAAPSDDLRVITIIDRGVREARALQEEPATQAALLQTLGSVSQRLGRYDRADDILTLALRQRQRLFGDRHPDTLETQIALGLLRIDQGRLADAETLVRGAFDLATSTLAADAPVRLRAAAALGRVLEERGDYARAIPLLERALDGYTRIEPDGSDRSDALTELANTHFYAGHLDASETLNERARDLDRRLHGDRHPAVGDDLLNLGAIATSRERFAQATAYNRQALDIMQAWYGENHPQTASAMAIVAQSLVNEKQYPEAATLLRRALVVQERLHGPVHRQVSFVLNELGILAQRTGDFAEAQSDFERSLAINRKVYSAAHFRVGVDLSNLGAVLYERRQYAQAERMLRESLTVYGKSLPPTHVNVASARIRLGRVLIAERRYDDAEHELLQARDILLGQSHPPETWLQMTGAELVKIATIQQRPDKVAEYRTLAAGRTAAAAASRSQR